MPKKKILIVDDQQLFTRLVKINLEATDLFEVRTENCGSNALKATKEFNPDLILLDIAMPDMSGSQVLQQLKADPFTRNVPVVFVTALVKKEGSALPGGTIDGQPFLAKPVRIKELLACIEQYIRK